MTSSLIGASKLSHINDAVRAVTNTEFADDELRRIESVLAS